MAEACKDWVPPVEEAKSVDNSVLICDNVVTASGSPYTDRKRERHDIFKHAIHSYWLRQASTA